MREILKELDDKITNEDLDMMIEEIDSDGSGTVDFDGKAPNTTISYFHLYIIINKSIERVAYFISFRIEFMEVMTGGDD